VVFEESGLIIFRFKLLYPLVFLVVSGLAVAEQPETVTNEQAAQSWQQNNLGGQTPQLVQQEDGTTKIEWKGGVSADVYTNSVTSSNGTINSPLRNGTFYKGMVQGDLRGINSAGSVNYLQFGLTQTDDRSVSSLYPHQINNIQLGRSSQSYLLAMGDVAPNFSSLSSALGARGIIGQKQIGDTTVYGYSGVVAESWEALDSLVVRKQFLRDVYGVKLEHTLTQGLKVYATGQTGSDREGSITNPSVAATALAAKLHDYSGGFQYAEGQFQLAGETASGGFQQVTQESHSGHASILDSGWRGQTVTIRAGYHDIDPGFASLSTMAVAGVKEIYGGGDWVVAPWITLGADLRNSKNSILMFFQSPGFNPVYLPTKISDTDSGALRANINFGPELPGWGLGLQQNESKPRDPMSNVSRNGQSSATLNYATLTWTSGLGYSLGKVRNEASPAMDSDTTSWQFMLGRSLNNADNATPASWMFNVNLNAALQDQQFLVTGTNSRNVNYSLTFAGQRVNWGSLNLVLTNGLTTRPTGQPDLKLRSSQLEALHPFSAQSSAKIYLRDTQRNIGDPLLGADERVVGAQLIYTF
jgi:hypothetical protein